MEKISLQEQLTEWVKKAQDDLEKTKKESQESLAKMQKKNDEVIKNALDERIRDMLLSFEELRFVYQQSIDEIDKNETKKIADYKQELEDAIFNSAAKSMTRTKIDQRQYIIDKLEVLAPYRDRLIAVPEVEYKQLSEDELHAERLNDAISSLMQLYQMREKLCNDKILGAQKRDNGNPQQLQQDIASYKSKLEKDTLDYMRKFISTYDSRKDQQYIKEHLPQEFKAKIKILSQTPQGLEGFVLDFIG